MVQVKLNCIHKFHNIECLRLDGRLCRPRDCKPALTVVGVSAVVIVVFVCSSATVVCSCAESIDSVTSIISAFSVLDPAGCSSVVETALVTVVTSENNSQ